MVGPRFMNILDNNIHFAFRQERGKVFGPHADPGVTKCSGQLADQLRFWVQPGVSHDSGHAFHVDSGFVERPHEGLGRGPGGEHIFRHHHIPALSGKPERGPFNRLICTYGERALPGGDSFYRGFVLRLKIGVSVLEHTAQPLDQMPSKHLR